ncbi:MAG: hypothetical protein FWJ34_07340 [Geminocystis sp. GBBB08]|nr:hypothetical protein [Geminocystis sp. GBBB08]
MNTQDNCCTLVPYFQVYEGKIDEFKELCPKFIEKTRQESKCLYYGFSFKENIVHCREGYEDAQGILNHLANVESLLKQALTISDLIRLEIHGNEIELEKLRQPLADFKPDFFVLEYGFRK